MNYSKTVNNSYLNPVNITDHPVASLDLTDAKTYSLARKIFEGIALILANIVTLGMVNIFKAVRDEYGPVFGDNSNRKLKENDEGEQLQVNHIKENDDDSTQLMTPLPLTTPSNISAADFNLLNTQEKSDLYRRANIEGNYDLVVVLNNLGMQQPIQAAVAPGIISPMMDIATKRATLLRYLQNLRQQGRLFTEDEFAKCEKKLWFGKNRGFERILGADLIQKKSKELGLNRMKVPKKILVICNPNTEQEELKIEGYCGQENLYYINSNASLTKDDVKKIQLYAQRVEPVSRYMSRDEINEFFVIIEATNFVDMWPSNVWLCEDGVYFIDTEFKGFCGSIQWEKMKRFMRYIAKEDEEYFLSEIERRVDKKTIDPDSFLSPSTLTYHMANFACEKILRKDQHQERELCLQTKKAFEAVGADKTDLNPLRPREFLLKISEILGENR